MLVVSVIIVITLIGILVLYLVPKLQISPIRSNPESKGPLEMENNYRQTLVQIFGGLAIVATVWAALDNAQQARLSFELARRGQVADRTFKALEMLSKENMDGKMGAVYVLLQVAGEDEKSEWPITETLFNYLQDHSAWPPRSIEEIRYQPRDISAISDFLRKRPYIGRDGKCQEEHQCWDYESRNRPFEQDISGYDDRIINLPGLDLRKIFLDRAMLKTVNINQSHLENSRLRRAHFENAYGFQAHLENADLSDSYWKFANLKDANLSSAQLCRAHFEHVYAEDANLANADLRNSHWENSLQFRVTNLKDANLTCTTWKGAEMDGLYLEGAKLFGADLRGAAHLTKAQLEKTQGDKSTQLDDESIRPAGWSATRTLCPQTSVPDCP